MSDIKPQDLRVGNYVKMKGRDEIFRVAIISETSSVALRTDKEFKGWTKTQNLEPLLIIEVCHHFEHPAELLWCGKDICEDLYYYNGFCITEFHHLQNLHYAITHKEIVLDI